MKLTLAKIKTLPIGKKISDGLGLCLTKTSPNKGHWEHTPLIKMQYGVKQAATVLIIMKREQQHQHRGQSTCSKPTKQ